MFVTFDLIEEFAHLVVIDVIIGSHIERFEFDRLSRFSNRSTIASPLAYDLMKSSLEGLASAFLHFLKSRIVNILLQRHGRPCIYRSRLHQIHYSIMM